MGINLVDFMILFLFGAITLSLANLFSVLHFAIPLILSIQRKHLLAQKIFIFSAPINFFFIYLFYAQDLSIHLYMFTLAVLAIFIFKKTILIYASLIWVALFFFVISISIKYQWFVPFSPEASNWASFFWWFNLFGAINTTIIFAVIFRLETRKYESKIRQQNGQLIEHKEELNQSLEELQVQRDYVTEKNKVLEEFNIKINSSLKVAQTIQEAMLPYQAKLDELLQNYFVINRPKDVVSGDFYWLNKINGKTILVVADCTGHGIPGAFMTLIGANLLDKIIRLRQVTQPADILTKLHEEIKLVLKQRYTANNKGMDAVIVTLEPQEDSTLMTFAGAKNNIYYAYNKELCELKGTRKSIGGFQSEIIQFTSQELNLPAGSTLYLGSDGLEDQNNSVRKRFGRKRLKNLLENLSHFPVTQQKASIEKTLDDYMEGCEQRDDILWMGVRL